jgi:hypothetical protein
MSFISSWRYKPNDGKPMFSLLSFNNFTAVWEQMNEA